MPYFHKNQGVKYIKHKVRGLLEVIMAKHTITKRNYLTLGASLLVVGLLEIYASYYVINYNWDVYQKTIVLMLMTGFGFSFASEVMSPLLSKSIRFLFNRRKFGVVGKSILYLLLYVALFWLYYWVAFVLQIA